MHQATIGPQSTFYIFRDLGQAMILEAPLWLLHNVIYYYKIVLVIEFFHMMESLEKCGSEPQFPRITMSHVGKRWELMKIS